MRKLHHLTTPNDTAYRLARRDLEFAVLQAFMLEWVRFTPLVDRLTRTAGVLSFILFYVLLIEGGLAHSSILIAASTLGSLSIAYRFSSTHLF